MAWAEFVEAVHKATTDNANLGSEAATWTPANGAPTVVNGIFDEQGADLLLEGGAVVSGASPRFGCRASDVPGAKQGDALTVSGRDFRLRDAPVPAGTDAVVLLLERFLTNP